MANTLIKSADVRKDPALMAIAALLLIAPHLTKPETKRILRGEDPINVAIEAAQRLNCQTAVNALQAAPNRAPG